MVETLGGWCYGRWRYLIKIFLSYLNALKCDATGLFEIYVRICGSKLFPATLWIVCLLLRHAWMVQHKWTVIICHFKRHRQAMYKLKAIDCICCLLLIAKKKKKRFIVGFISTQVKLVFFIQAPELFSKMFELLFKWLFL